MASKKGAGSAPAIADSEARKLGVLPGERDTQGSKANPKKSQERNRLAALSAKIPSSIKVHPAADDIPPASDAEYLGLVSDIDKNGLRELVVMVSVAGGPPQLLDGRHRLRALVYLGREIVDDAGNINPEVSRIVNVVDDAAAKRLSISHNAHRRHLAAKDRRRLVQAAILAEPEKSNRQIGEIIGVSHPTVAIERKKLEAKGDVEKVSTSTDTKGRKQPRKRKQVKCPVVEKPAKKSEPVNTTPETKAEVPEPQVPLDRNPICRAWRLASEEERAEFAVTFGDAVMRYETPAEIDRAIRVAPHAPPAVPVASTTASTAADDYPDIPPFLRRAPAAEGGQK